MHKLKTNSYVSLQKPFITRKHITARRNWAKMNKKRTSDTWATDTLADESNCTVFFAKIGSVFGGKKSVTKPELRHIYVQFRVQNRQWMWCVLCSRTDTGCTKLKVHLTSTGKEILEAHIPPFRVET